MGLVAKRLEHEPNSEPPKVIIKSVNPEYDTYERDAREGADHRPRRLDGEAPVRRFRNEPIFLKPAKWVGTATGVAGAVQSALNIGAVAAGFALFLISPVLWGAVGWIHREPSLVVLPGAFTAINLLGLHRWATF